MFVFVWIFVWLSFPRASAYIETVIVSGCESCKLHLTCRHLTSIIAILEAEFVPEFNETSLNGSTLVPTAFPPVHPRQALNRRCSGVNHCSFILTEDCPGANDWGAGNLTVKYVCVSDDQIRKFCNSEIVLPDSRDPGISEGFIHNPGYPRFYSSERECRWKIRAPQEQRIRITVLDISVTADRTTYADDCTDRLEVIDSGQVIGRTCKQQEPPFEILSDSEFMEVVLASTHSLMPLRGILVHYTAVGCSTPDAPEDGYLVYRNDTVAEFRCCVDLTFADNGEKTKIINCLGAHWDVDLPLPNCTSETKKLILPIQESRKPQKLEMASDILAPALLIAALFLINFIVLFYIYKIKQKHATEFADEELGTLPLSNNEKISP
ncbi:hypothetical protein MTP99_009734 [Tenebrio molitor]|uniref:uncharacterized protein isoform X1 n=1 Tax=Tenebrio molitor TaxID=7067 RepID=UPI00270F1D68|nr:hypothetical protein MTP99_009734 [Tenebrio molitor]